MEMGRAEFLLGSSAIPVRFSASSASGGQSYRNLGRRYVPPYSFYDNVRTQLSTGVYVSLACTTSDCQSRLGTVCAFHTGKVWLLSNVERVLWAYKWEKSLAFVLQHDDPAEVHWLFALSVSC